MLWEVMDVSDVDSKYVICRFIFVETLAGNTGNFPFEFLCFSPPNHLLPRVPQYSNYCTLICVFVNQQLLFQ